MNTRQTRLLLWYTAGSLSVASVGAVAAGSLWSFDVPAPDRPRVTRPPTQPAGVPTGVALGPLSAFEKTWSVNLRRPLHDRPAAVKAEPTRKIKRPLPVRLAGTVVEPGHSIAMFVTSKGAIELKGIGQRVANAEVLSITQAGVSVRYHGEVIELSLEQGRPKK